MANPLLIDLRSTPLPESIGSKARNLRVLHDHKFRVPRTLILPWTAYQQYRAGDLALVEQIQRELPERLDAQACYAVRSSAAVEDGASHSFAGQFKSVLNVTGFNAIFTAIWSIWATADAAGVNQYAEHKGEDAAVKMAVILQEMVTPVYSGVVFSRNPMTGTSEIVVEAVRGVGTALMQDGLTPDRWVKHQKTWIATPDETEIPLSVIESAAEGARTISKKIGKDVDLEWVYNGSELVWVQMREITALKNVQVYSNRLSKEMMPGIIKPLIWSINIPLINTVWIKLMEEMVGSTGLKPEDLARSFYFRSYFNMGAIGRVFNLAGFPSEGLEMLMGVITQREGRPMSKPTMRSLRLLPRMTAFLVDKWNFHRKIEAKLPGIRSAIMSIPLVPGDSIDDAALVKKIEQIYQAVQAVTYYNVVVPLLVSMYTRLLGQDLKKLGVDIACFDLAEGIRELDNFNPNVHLKKLHRQSGELSEGAQAVLREGTYAELKALPGIEPFAREVQSFIQRFGHFSNNSNDFSAVPWRESPEMILRLIAGYEKQDEEAGRRVTFAQLRAKGTAGGRLRILYQKARTMVRWREEVSSLYVYGYGLFRPYLLELATRWQARGWLESADDVFYIPWSELKAAAAAGHGSMLRETARRQRDEIERVRSIELPEVIYGGEAPPVFASAAGQMSGTPTSRGYYSGPARIVRGIEDFHKLSPGDVLVIPYSDVGWTPLFAKAGAVIAESGGMLSHSSIIAREYGIPAVVSAASAVRLKDGQRVHVDGFRGIITLLEGGTGE